MKKERMYGVVDKSVIEALKFYELDPKKVFVTEVTLEGVRVKLEDGRETMLRI